MQNSDVLVRPCCILELGAVVLLREWLYVYFKMIHGQIARLTSLQSM